MQLGPLSLDAVRAWGFGDHWCCSSRCSWGQWVWWSLSLQVQLGLVRAVVAGDKPGGGWQQMVLRPAHWVTGDAVDRKRAGARA